LSYRLPRINRNRPTIISWAQLAVHFGNDGANIRKFRQTIRDSWERQVSAVYPEARAEFDTTAVRLYASPAPLARQPLRLISVLQANAPLPMPTVPAPTSATDFLGVLRTALGETHARHWLSDAVLEDSTDGPALHVGTQFKADFIRRTFVLEIERAAVVCGLAPPPAILANKRPAH
jgi:hypothetical protein